MQRNYEKEIDTMYYYDYKLKLINDKTLSKEEIEDIIRKHSLYIENVDNQWEELQWIAIKDDIWNYQYLDNPTEEMLDYCLSKNGHIIQFVSNPTEKQIKKAINKNWMSIVHIKKPTLEMCKQAFKIARLSIEYMPDDMANLVKL